MRERITRVAIMEYITHIVQNQVNSIDDLCKRRTFHGVLPRYLKIRIFLAFTKYEIRIYQKMTLIETKFYMCVDGFASNIYVIDCKKLEIYYSTFIQR